MNRRSFLKVFSAILSAPVASLIPTPFVRAAERLIVGDKLPPIKYGVIVKKEGGQITEVTEMELVRGGQSYQWKRTERTFRVVEPWPLKQGDTVGFTRLSDNLYVVVAGPCHSA